MGWPKEDGEGSGSLQRQRRTGDTQASPAYTGFETFRDSESGPYLRSELRRLSPEETWSAINSRLHGLLRGMVERTRRGPIRITPCDLDRWHAYMFGKDFVSAGQIRRGDVEYPVRVMARGEVRERRQRGSAPDRISSGLDVTCRAFRDHVETVLERGGRIHTMSGALAATKLYAGILQIHPYEDGNGRTAFVALQAALLSQGMYVITFDDLEQHDGALGWALRDDARADPNPFATLLVERTMPAVEESWTDMLEQ